MKSKEVLKLLGVTRVTLTSYVKKNIIKVTLLANGYYDYDDASVYQFLGRNKRINLIYARVSTYKQKKDLKKQVKILSDYCSSNKIPIEETFSEISSGIDFDRPEFSKILYLVFDNKVDTIYITHKDRLSRLSYLTIKSIFKKFGTKIVVIKSPLKDSDNELFDEVMSIMHLLSTKEYSNRRKELKTI